ncbi:MAG: tripartite tricarboxylate transporter substrate binding protein [Betaproteobacteria bacterium]
MRILNNLVAATALVAVLPLSAPSVAQAQTASSQTIRIVVPYTPGGPADVLARALAQELTTKWGQTVIVDNRPGANEIIAAQEVARAAADGTTFLIASDAVFSLNKHLYSKLPYEPTDFVPVSKLVNANLMLVARTELPANSVSELVEYSRKNPGQVTYSSVGAGGVNHLAMAWFDSINNIQMVHVPYKGLAQALQDMVGGRVDTGFAVIGGAAPLLQAGKLKALAVAGKNRSVLMPNVPTFAEAGYPQFDASFYFAAAAPKGTPAAPVRRFDQDAGAILNSPEFKSKYLTNLGFEPVGDTPEQFSAFLATDREMAEKKVKISGAKLD